MSETLHVQDTSIYRASVSFLKKCNVFYFPSSFSVEIWNTLNRYRSKLFGKCREFFSRSEILHLHPVGLADISHLEHKWISGFSATILSTLGGGIEDEWQWCYFNKNKKLKITNFSISRPLQNGTFTLSAVMKIFSSDVSVFVINFSGRLYTLLFHCHYLLILWNFVFQTTNK